MSLTREKFVEVYPGQRERWFLWDRPDPVTSIAWDKITGKPSTFPPSFHEHTWDEILDKPTTFPTDPVGIFDLIDWHFNALKDTDGEVLLDTDGTPIYEPGVPYDNPPVPTRYIDTVAEMLALDSGQWDRVVTRNELAGDGIRSEWRFAGDPVLSDDGVHVRAVNDGFGFAERVIRDQIRVFPNMNAAQATTIWALLVYIEEDDNAPTNWGIFYRDDAYSIMTEGVDGFTDNAGSIFKRKG